MELSDLLKQVKELELVARKNAYSLLDGSYITSLPGRGLMFQEARKYVRGESIRMIDWNMTARLGEPYVKVFQDEREREVFIALDVSPSMYTGWQDKNKIEYAVEVAATLAVSAISSKDKLGCILFNENAVDVYKPSSGKVQLFRVLKKLVEFANQEPLPCKVSDIRAAIHAVEKYKGKRFVIFIISDFVDQDVPDDLKYLRAIHDLSLIHIYDPLEYEENKEIFFDAYSPEGDAHTMSIYPGEMGSLDKIQNYLLQECYKHRIAFQSLSTTSPVHNSLRELFHKKKRNKL